MTTHVGELVELFDYGYWANRRLFGALKPLAPEELAQVVGGSYGSIRNTLVHALSAEWGWLDRCGGPPRGPKLDPLQFPTLAPVVVTWTWVEGHMRDFLARLRDEDLAREVRFSLGGSAEQVMPVGQLLRHAAVHGVHHRGQVSLLLRMLGHAPGNVDMLMYYAERT